MSDGEEESQQWETEFLTEDSVKTHLQTKAVTLRLQAGSEEAGYLEALFPVPRKPTVVIIEYVAIFLKPSAMIPDFEFCYTDDIRQKWSTQGVHCRRHDQGGILAQAEPKFNRVGRPSSTGDAKCTATGASGGFNHGK